MNDWGHELGLPGLEVATVASWFRPWDVVRAFAPVNRVGAEGSGPLADISESWAEVLSRRVPLQRVVGAHPGVNARSWQSFELSPSAGIVVADVERLALTIAGDMAAARAAQPAEVVQGEDAAEVLGPLSTVIGVQVCALLAESPQAMSVADLVREVTKGLDTEPVGDLARASRLPRDLPSFVKARVQQCATAGLLTRAPGDPASARRFQSGMLPVLTALPASDRLSVCETLRRLTHRPRPLTIAAVAIEAAAASGRPIEGSRDLAGILGVTVDTGREILARLAEAGAIEEPTGSGVRLVAWLRQVLAVAVSAGDQATRHRWAGLGMTIVDLLADPANTAVLRAVDSRGSTAAELVAVLDRLLPEGATGSSVPGSMEQRITQLVRSGLMTWTLAESDRRVSTGAGSGSRRVYRVRSEVAALADRLRRFPAAEFPSSAILDLLPAMLDRVGAPTAIARLAGITPATLADLRFSTVRRPGRRTERDRVWRVMLAVDLDGGLLRRAEAIQQIQQDLASGRVDRADILARSGLTDAVLAAVLEGGLVAVLAFGEQLLRPRETIAQRLEALTGIPANTAERLVTEGVSSDRGTARLLAWGLAELARQAVEPATAAMSALLHGQITHLGAAGRTHVAAISGVPVALADSMVRGIPLSAPTARLLDDALRIAADLESMTFLLGAGNLDDGPIATEVGDCRVVSLSRPGAPRMLLLRPRGSDHEYAIAVAPADAALPKGIRRPEPRMLREISADSINAILGEVHWAVAVTLNRRVGLLVE